MCAVARDKPFDTLDDFIKNIHKEGSALIDFNGNKVPCIYECYSWQKIGGRHFTKYLS